MNFQLISQHCPTLAEPVVFPPRLFKGASQSDHPWGQQRRQNLTDAAVCGELERLFDCAHCQLADS